MYKKYIQSSQKNLVRSTNLFLYIEEILLNLLSYYRIPYTKLHPLIDCNYFILNSYLLKNIEASYSIENGGLNKESPIIKVQNLLTKNSSNPLGSWYVV